MQLDAFLRSYEDQVTPLGTVHVLYLATSLRHMRAYQEVFHNRSWVVPVSQRSFKADLLSLLPDDGCVTFFVDDQLFIRPWFVVDEPGLSLRLGLNLTHNYASGDSVQRCPLLRLHGDGRLTWRWDEGELAWGYPLSLDGHVFDLAAIRPLIEALFFYSPNTLESALQLYAQEFSRGAGICYYASRVVNVPWNRVQTDWENRSGGVGSEQLLDLWEAGQRIKASAFYGVENTSVHQEFPLVLEARC